MKIKNNLDKKTQGLMLGLTGMGIFGLFPVFSNYFVKSFDPLIFGGLVTLIGSLPLIIRACAKGNQKYLFSKTEYSRSLLAVAMLSGIATLLFFLGTKLTSGINTSLLSQIEPMYAVIIAYFILGENIKAKELGAIVLMVIGACAVVFKGFTAPNIGDLLIFITPVFYQFSHVFSKSIINKIPDSSILGAARLFYGGLILTILGIIWHPTAFLDFLSLKNIAYLVLFAFIFRTLDMLFWYSALKRLPLSIVSALIPVSLPIAFIGSIFILKEIPTIQQYIGLFAILFGLIWISLLHLKQGNDPVEQLEH